MRERILVLAVDIDNDLFRKAKIAGPVLGKEENLKAAAALAKITRRTRTSTRCSRP